MLVNVCCSRSGSGNISNKTRVRTLEAWKKKKRYHLEMVRK